MKQTTMLKMPQANIKKNCLIVIMRKTYTRKEDLMNKVKITNRNLNKVKTITAIMLLHLMG